MTLRRGQVARLPRTRTVRCRLHGPRHGRRLRSRGCSSLLAAAVHAYSFLAMLRTDDGGGRKMPDALDWNERVSRLVENLRCFEASNVFNQWEATHREFDCEDAAAIRRSNLLAYLLARPRPRFVFVGEAPSWRGARFSGIPMTSERILLGGHPALPASDVLPGAEGRRTSRSDVEYPSCDRTGGITERTATGVWKTALAQGLAATDFVLWNAMPWHAHQGGKPLSNRTSQYFTSEEKREGRRFLRELLQGLYPSARSVALGEYSTCELLKAERRAVPHPSQRRGEFESEFARVLSCEAARHGGDGITLAMNRVCDEMEDRPDGFRDAAARDVLAHVEW